MRLSASTSTSTSIILILTCCVALIAAWSKEDQEIFRLRDEVERADGPGLTFYNLLGLTPSASQDDINKAYKKKSRTLHPDKIKQQLAADKAAGKDGKAKSASSSSASSAAKSKSVATNKNKKKPGARRNSNNSPSKSEVNAALKAASDRFARLGVVTNILRGSGRERYDHFLNNGFPTWKGTGYYYARFRPGLGTVLSGLFVFVGGAGHWLALYMSWRRQTVFVERYIKFARHAAWGDNLGIAGLDATPATPTAATVDDSDAAQQQPQAVNRRQRRMQDRDAARKDKKNKGLKGAASKGSAASLSSPPAGTPVSSTGPRKRVVAENGKILVVDTVGNVYLEQADEDGTTQEFLLDPSELARPTIRDTALYRVPIWVFNRLTGRASGTTGADDEERDAAAAEYSEHGDADTPGTSSDEFEVLDREKIGSGTTAPNGVGSGVASGAVSGSGGKAHKRNKKGGR